MALKVICINKDSGNHENPYVAISILGVEGNSGKTRYTRIEMYDYVKGGGEAYVLDAKGNKARLIAEISARGNKYVKTVADDVTTDNLLKLPECR